jgi:hypothetical protein
MVFFTLNRSGEGTFRRVAQAKIRTKFGSFRGTRRAELAQIVTALAEMPIRRSFFWFSRNREKAKKYSSSLVFPANESAPNASPRLAHV